MAFNIILEIPDIVFHHLVEIRVYQPRNTLPRNSQRRVIGDHHMQLGPAILCVPEFHFSRIFNLRPSASGWGF